MDQHGRPHFQQPTIDKLRVFVKSFKYSNSNTATHTEEILLELIASLEEKLAANVKNPLPPDMTFRNALHKSLVEKLGVEDFDKLVKNFPPGLAFIVDNGPDQAPQSEAVVMMYGRLFVALGLDVLIVVSHAAGYYQYSMAPWRFFRRSFIFTLF